MKFIDEISNNNIITVDDILWSSKRSLTFLGFRNFVILSSGFVWNINKKDWCAIILDRRGYRRVNMLDDNGKTHTIRIHTLVAKSFILNPENKPQVNHIDGNKLNNDVSNLEWCTNLENAKHARLNNLMPHNVLSDEETHNVCKLLEQGWLVTEIVNKYKYPYHTIWAIRGKRNWKHISDLYNIPPTNKINRLSTAKVEEICMLIKNDISCRQIANIYEVSPSTIENIKNKIIYKDITLKLLN
jgi:hypothetical protein